MSNLLSSYVRRLSKNYPLSGANVFPTDVTALRNAARSAAYPSSVGAIFDNVPINNINGRARIGYPNSEISMGSADKMLRRGDLRAFTNNVGSAVPVSNAQQTAFRRTIPASMPGPKLRELDELTVTRRRQHPDLDLDTSTYANGTELRNAMTPGARSKFEAAMSKLRAAVVTGAVAFGVFAAITLSLNYYDAILEATNNKRGCFIVTTQNNKPVVCRLLERTCQDPKDSMCDTGVVFPTNLPFNIKIMLIRAVDDNTLATTILAALSITLSGGETFVTTLPTILNSSEHLATLDEFYSSADPPPVLTGDKCQSNAIIEPNIGLCVACDETFGFDDVRFFDGSDLAENFMMQCVPTGSLLDTIIDLGFGLDLDLLGSLGRFSGSMSGNIGWILLIFAAIVAIVVVLLAIFKKKN